MPHALQFLLLTVTGWVNRHYRRLIAQKYDGSPRRRRGRPMMRREIVDLVVRMAGKNPQWATRGSKVH